ncbi:hypothetical protein ACGFX4_34225 [Kitasatospora sp. NPDC048365]|uniref:hypothetical protein n=1 Tax=Kitasatospora sp. NPDC048365 TaxID=3364050 RepID=UPI003712F8F2
MDAFERAGDAGQQPRTAAYLRSYPFDPTGMECQRWALDSLAADHGLPEPQLHIDNGLRVADGLPALDALLRAVAAGWITAVLVPGLYVFGLRAEQTASVLRVLDLHGCRLLQLPSRHARARGTAPDDPIAAAA